MGDASQIVRAVIYPFLGIARVGNSREPDGWFVGPEVPEPRQQDIEFYRDRQGALKRQAARFRIYGVDANDRVVREITTDEAEIEWTVHLCNRKAHWYQFQIAQDIDEARSMPQQMLRNSTVGNRTQLIIDPGPRTITGCEISGRPYCFDTGSFMGRNVPLGELRTDSKGRLLVLGGYGIAGSVDGSLAHSSANNDGWFDDTSDGPVAAKVKLDHREIAVVSAWVAVAPPNYAPMLKSVRTMWDRIEELNGLPAAQPSFNRDIRPIFHRLSMLQWVNAGFAATFGWGGPYDFTSEEWLARLSSPAPAKRPVRVTLFKHFRQPDRDGISPVPWPWIYGDSINARPLTNKVYASLGPNQTERLRRWADGDFVSDYDPAAPALETIEEAPIDEQGPLLDRAAMEFCVADVFEPGIELPWIMRDPSLYARTPPFFPRIRSAPDGWKEPSYGPYLDYGDMRAMGQIPGSLTRWLAVPWQSDAASCLAAYRDTFGNWVPTLWPARVPNHVLQQSDYEIVMGRGTDPDTRTRAFERRVRWQENTSGVAFGLHVNDIVDDPAQLGLVVASPGPRTGDVPDRIFVEYRRTPR